jgi:sulfur-carrier protein
VISSRSLTRRHLHYPTACIKTDKDPGATAPGSVQRRITQMAKVTIQYWAAAREAAGVELESVEASTLAEALDVVVARRGDGGRLRSVLAASSFLVDGAAASRAAAPGVVLPDAAVIEVLPQFAGG